MPHVLVRAAGELPRSWKRSEWKLYHRYCRVTSNMVKALIEEDAYRTLMFGNCMSEEEKESFVARKKTQRGFHL